jgi:hypothetical protein
MQLSVLFIHITRFTTILSFIATFPRLENDEFLSTLHRGHILSRLVFGHNAIHNLFLWRKFICHLSLRKG